MRENFLTRLFSSKNYSNEWDNNNLPISSLTDVPFSALKTMTHYHNDQYENGYSDIRAIANRFLAIKPYAIDANGKPIEKTPNAMNCLARPNQQTSGIDFRDQFAVMTLVHDKVYILVWQRQGQEVFPATDSLREDNIAGYTFLEDVQEQVLDGKLRYTVYTNGQPQSFTPEQVMTFYDVNPSALSNGYSPSRSARRWTRIEDYIADYQTGFFENGAVPAGMFMITAPTKRDYEDIVKNMKNKHRGAGKNNNVMYSYQPIDPVTNKPGQAAVTWIPFNVNNRELSLQELFDQSSKKISASFGVPDFIKGDAEAPNFATAQVIERNFVENKMRPFAIKKWARFQHELNRITGGLGYGITFDLDTPNIAEEEESVARTNTLNVTAISTLTSLGYTLDSTIDALGLPNNWKLLEKGTSTTTTIDNDKSDVDEGDEVESSPDKLGAEAAIRKNPKAHSCDHDIKDMTSSDQSYYQSQIELVAANLMQKQVDDAIAALDGQVALTEEDQERFLQDMMAIITVVLVTEGLLQYEQGKLLLISAGLTAPDGSYSVSAKALTRYRDYLKTVYTSYTDDTAATIRTVLDRSVAEGWTRQQTEQSLRGVMNTDSWRVKRIGVSETNRSGAMASVESMIQLEEEASASFEKTMMSTTGSPCEFCASLIGVWIPVNDVFVNKGDMLNGKEGGVFVNNWDDNIGHDIHANGKCVPEYRVVR